MGSSATASPQVLERSQCVTAADNADQAPVCDHLKPLAPFLEKNLGNLDDIRIGLDCLHLGAHGIQIASANGNFGSHPDIPGVDSEREKTARSRRSACPPG